ILQDKEDVGALLGHHRKSALEVLRLSHLLRLKRHSQRASRILRLFPSKPVSGVGCIPKNRASRQTGYHFLEYFQTFCAELRIENRKSRNIAARVSEAADEAGPHRVNGSRVDDRNGRGCIPRREGCGRRDHDDDVDFQSNHLRRKLLESLRTTLCIAPLNDDVLPLRVSQFPQALEQGVIKTLMPVCDKSHPPNFTWLLRVGGERPCHRGPAEHRHELAALHSITSSARASSEDGSSSPSALAVFRLITSSYLVGACTGRSAGFSPFRMRST